MNVRSINSNTAEKFLW